MQILLKERPINFPDENTWECVNTGVRKLNEGEFLVQVTHISLDPAMRGWLNDVRSYVAPVKVGEVMRALAAGKIVESRHPHFSVGQQVSGTFGVTEWAISDGKGASIIDPEIAKTATWLGALGMTGMTAYFGLFDVGKIGPTDTVLVSGAAGAVGSIAGQLAKAEGATVIGIAGDDKKCNWLVDELGFDGAINYKNENVTRRIRELAPRGIDIFFDNVGGAILDSALANLTVGARVVICGAISSYNESKLPPGPSRYMSLLVFRASMTGFVVTDYEHRYREAAKHIANLISQGKLTPREHIIRSGIDTFGQALLSLFKGENTGKMVLEIQ